MATMRANPRLQVGSASWIAEERASALQIAEAESEEFTFSARNEVDWLNEHMAEIFSENQLNVAEIFKTPGKLRGKTPRTARKANALEARAPLSDVFSATPRGGPSPFKQIHFAKPVPTFQVAEDEPTQSEKPSAASIPGVEDPFQQRHTTNAPNYFDSGYYGSQAIDATQPTQPNDPIYQPTPKASPLKASLVEPEPEPEEDVMDESQETEERRSTEGSFQSAKEEQTRHINEDIAPDMEVEKPSKELELSTRPVLESPLQSRTQQVASPQKRSPERPAPIMESPPKPEQTVAEDAPEVDDVQMEDAQSPQSDGSSPIRPIVRKSSLNFASLPAREPLTSKKSIGNRVSRTSQLDQPRTSYYGPHTGGKSIGHVRQEDDKEDGDEMDIEEMDAPGPVRDDAARLHNKTSTQRLQDQISMLGKSQNARPPSKSITANGLAMSQASQPGQVIPHEESRQQKSPQRKERPPPGAFPDDEDDSWIGPPNAGAEVQRSIFSPRPQITKSHSTDVMEGIRGKDSIGGAQFNIPKRGEEQRQKSPLREPTIADRTTSTLGHIKSVSTSVLRSPKKAGDSPENKGISVSNPNPSTGSDGTTTPPKSPARSYRGSPLKAAKDKFSSILKTSRGLFASSAAVSADAKSNLSPSSSRMGLNHAPSMQSLFQSQPSYPDLALSKTQSSTLKMPDSPTRSVRKTRASTEREERKKHEEAKEAKEAKEAQKMNDQLEKARQKVKEEARVYHIEQERVAAMQKEVAARKEKERAEKERAEKERAAKESQVDLPRATRSSPRKTKAQLEAEGIAAAAPAAEESSSKDVEMSDASQSMPPPAAPRPKSQIGRPISKRPLKPAKETQSRAKPPTVIRVDTGSQRGHQYHPSNSTLAATLQDSLPAAQSVSSSQSSQGTLRNKASTSSIQSKTSTSSFKSAATKALEAAARKKEQDELAAQKKRDAKQEVERQRAAIKEEERRKEEQQRRQELERQREIQRERERVAAAADAKKAASRQAMEKRRLEMERAKETRPPPPAVRPQPGGDMHEKALPPVPQAKAPRMNSTAPRTQEEVGQSVNAIHHSTKAPPKRPLQQDVDEHHPRPTIQRNGPSYQQNDTHTKRRKTSEAFDDDDDLTENHPKMTAPPIRQSNIRQKEMPTKSLFPSGYPNAPATGNLQRTTLISQHNMNQSKPAHPLDMTQVSKAPIAFASSSSQANGQPYKTPARPAHAGGKSTAKSAKSSPRYRNGENIDLPEIQTDSEDEDEGEGEKFDRPSWADTPAVEKALAFQEGLDPATVFGQPRPLDMEAVFSKSKDKFHKFRARTSSANWSGEDRLTQDEIRKDVEARDKLRRQGFWTYDHMV